MVRRRSRKKINRKIIWARDRRVAVVPDVRMDVGRRAAGEEVEERMDALHDKRQQGLVRADVFVESQRDFRLRNGF